MALLFFLRILGFRLIHFLKERIYEGVFHLLISTDHGILDLMVGCGCFFCHAAGFQRTIFLQKFVYELVLNSSIAGRSSDQVLPETPTAHCPQVFVVTLPVLPLLQSFYEIHRICRSKEISLKNAAKLCEMTVGTFYGKTGKFEIGD